MHGAVIDGVLVSGHMNWDSLTVRKWNVAFAIYVIAGLIIDAALAYCSKHGADDLHFCREVLQLRYLAESVDNINAILEGGGVWLHIKACANEWIAEYKLDQWLTSVNESIGVAPSFESVFAKYTSLSANHADQDSSHSSLDRRRKWVQRFMAKWQASRGSIHSHEAESVSEVVRKARALVNNKHIFGQNSRSHFQNYFRPQIGVLCIRFLNNIETKTTPKPEHKMLFFSREISWYSGAYLLAMACTLASQFGA